MLFFIPPDAQYPPDTLNFTCSLPTLFIGGVRFYRSHFLRSLWRRRPIKRKTNCAIEIEEHVLGQIFKGYWKQGDRIDDSVIAKEFNVSRNSVREALSRLVALRVLKKEHWAGYHVPMLDKKEALDTLKMRETLEIKALEAFMKRLDTVPDLLNDVANSIKLAEEVKDDHDFDAFIRADDLMHKTIRNNCGNSWIPHFLDQIWPMVIFIRKMDANAGFEKFSKRSIGEHKKLLQLIKKGDITEAVNCLSEHMQHQQRRLDALFDVPSDGNK